MKENQSITDSYAIINITSKMFNDSVKSKNSSIEYNGITIYEVCYVGYILGVQSEDNKYIINMWDHTGMIEVTFFKSDRSLNQFGFLNDMSIVLNGTYRVFASTKCYKEKLYLHGIKIVKVDDNEFMYHQLEVVANMLQLKKNVIEEKPKDNFGLGNIDDDDSFMFSNKKLVKDFNLNFIENNVFQIMKDFSMSGNGTIDKIELITMLNKKNYSTYDINSTIKKLKDLGQIQEAINKFILF